MFYNTKATNKTYFSLLWSKPRLSKKVWLKRKELINYSKLVIWATGCEDLRFSFELLRVRIDFIWSHSGSNFLFKYLKEVTRVTVRVLAGQEPLYSRETYTKITPSTGLPAIIPIEIQRVILEKGALSSRRRTIVALITILSVYRVLPTTVKYNLDSIVQPFSGISRSFDLPDIRKAIDRLGLKNLRLTKSKLIGSEASGPNSYKAVWGTVIDALAFIHNPTAMKALVKWMWKHNRLYLVWFFTILCIASPYYLISLVFGSERANLGRLATVYDQAGKARIVAITNWWIQFNLKPLHDAIFAALRRIPTDGTFDQVKPFELLISKAKPGQVFHGFDLSSATDRLPVDLQADILHLLGVDGQLWKDMLSIPWVLPDGDGTTRYRVGQPMGALSSWGMLALTHHVIVQYSSLKANVINFSDYCILGDDVVIANDAVAAEYLKIMDFLGLKISVGKSVESSRFTEFAKKLQGPGVNISPIGPGLLVRVIRDRFYLTRLITELLEMKLIRFHEVVENVMVAPKFIRRYYSLLMWTLLIQNLALIPDPSNGFPMGGRNIMDARLAGSIRKLNDLVEDQVKDHLTKGWVQLKREVKFFLLNSWRVSQIRVGLPYLSDVLFTFVSPGTFYIIGSYLESIRSLCQKRVLWDEYLILKSEGGEPLDLLKILLEILEAPTIKSIDWREKEKIRDQSQFYGKLSKILDNPTEQDEFDFIPIGWYLSELSRSQIDDFEFF
ncbi:RNA-dependent RNA polymerase [Botryosphaeria dothidea mitovirus 1]|uniref:RNA-dependent RNA polymerase n=1 Tax=Botryosphaeria dothidea mitovirus 1 TaxID=2760745 RepID=A0ABX6QU31_9VIRU|nr:RNA-dependent RNA polymerase [Botryosphaeria dothidea mitovirus 1]QMU24933.1 RNA-dependent RNA polymerase [Botryosphaeria dothidea mitovirus 1]